jgi:hypothetical protein
MVVVCGIQRQVKKWTKIDFVSAWEALKKSIEKFIISFVPIKVKFFKKFREVWLNIFA